MLIKHTLLKKKKPRKCLPKVEIDLYGFATELYEELDSMNVIQRIKSVPQLGIIKTSKDLKKSRYDYTILQLYFHQLIKNKLQDRLELTYNNYVKVDAFGDKLSSITNKNPPTIADLLQVLVIVYNIGHFYNTFVSSRAAIIYANQCPEFKELIIQASEDGLYQKVARKVLSESNYQRFHLLNSLLILQKCNQDKKSVQLAKSLLYSYINEEELSEDNKLRYVFRLFRSVRDVAYVSFDLQIAITPLTIDLCDPAALLLLFKELLSVYNDNQSTKQLVASIGKLLDDTVYNEESYAICYYMISQRMVHKLQQISSWDVDHYYDYWDKRDSLFNMEYPQKRDYVKRGILKLTFLEDQKDHFQKLFNILSHINGVRVGYYDRHQGEQTVLISLKSNCKTKLRVAFHILRIVVSALRDITLIEATNSKYLLVTKFFLFYLFNEHPVIIKSTINSEVCVVCTRGNRQRINEIQKLIKLQQGNADQRHELENIRLILERDKKNDICITIPASILVYNKEQSGKMMVEFDGMIIYPNRKQKPLVFLEAKNTTSKPMYGKNCLKKKLGKLNILFNEQDIQMQENDAFMYFDV